MSTRRYEGGALRELWDDDAVPRTYSAWDAAGALTTSRPYTPEENARADAEAAGAVVVANTTAVTDALRAAIDALVTSRANLKSSILDPTNATINSGPAPFIKALAKAVRDDEQTLARICRLLARQLDSADAGPAVAAP